MLMLSSEGLRAGDLAAVHRRRSEAPAGDLVVVIERDPPAFFRGVLDQALLRLDRLEGIDVVRLIPRGLQVSAGRSDVAEMEERLAAVGEDRALMARRVSTGDDDAQARRQ